MTDVWLLLLDVNSIFNTNKVISHLRT